MLEKKAWDSKQSDPSGVNPNMKEETLSVMKKDPMTMSRLRHPSILSLIEPPQEDDKYVVYITEPIEYCLACLADNSKSHLQDKIPSLLEIKILVLELFEAINFLHQNAKQLHCGISPENLFITKTGKIKVAGFNFGTQIATEQLVPIVANPNLKFNEFCMVPNLRFAAPEMSQISGRCSVFSDLYSLGCIIYFMLCLDLKKDPYLMSFFDTTNCSQHSTELAMLPNKLSSRLQAFDDDIVQVLN